MHFCKWNFKNALIKIKGVLAAVSVVNSDTLCWDTFNYI